jgi:predicted  nucleic acid-binding Zn-ribbon protein
MSFQDKRKDPTDAKAVINGLATSALGYLQTPEKRNAEQTVQSAEAQIQAAQDEIDEATAGLNAIYEKVQSSRPADELSELRGEKQFYERQQAAALADANPTGAAAYQTRIDQANLRIFALEDVMAEVQDFEQRIATAQETLATAQDPGGAGFGGCPAGRRVVRA